MGVSLFDPLAAEIESRDILVQEPGGEALRRSLLGHLLDLHQIRDN